jgi:zinc D-Ala-D-Ala carboxypeptidase
VGDLSRHFSRSEFVCHCGRCGCWKVLDELVIALEQLRERVGVPIKVVSGRRCPAHNERVHGSRSSQHLLGSAADVIISGLSVAEMFYQAESVVAFESGGIGVYDGGFIHVDVRVGGPKRWMRIGKEYLAFDLERMATL